MEILAAYDLTGSLRAAAELAGCSHHTVARHVAARDAGQPIAVPVYRRRVTDAYLPKIEEWIEPSKGKIRADKAHEKLRALGYEGSERSTRRAVAQVRAAWRLGHVRVHRPWVTEPGQWIQYDFGDGPLIEGKKTVLFVAWLAWARFRVVIALRDRTAPNVFAALDRTFRGLGGAPTYVLTDNEKTVTVSHVAGVPVRNQQTVDFARHYGVTVLTCQPADPASKGGVESSVKLAKADIVPKDTNLRAEYASFGEIEAACEALMDEVNHREHRATRRKPAVMLAEGSAAVAPDPGHRTHRRVRPLTGRPGEHSDGPPSRTASTPSRHISSARGSSSDPTAPDPTSRSSSSTTAARGRWKSPGTGAPGPAARQSTTPTFRTTGPGFRAITRQKPGRPRKRSSLASVTAPAPGCSRPQRRARPG
ncbi:hypothetical protein GCM10009712_37680 [Pseudarthrobacter sulfonivorans]